MLHVEQERSRTVLCISLCWPHQTYCYVEGFPLVPVCYMSRTLFQIKPRLLLLALSTSQSWYRQHNPSTKHPSWKEQLIKSVISWNLTRGTGRYFLCLFSYNVIHRKDTWTLTVVVSYSSVQTGAVLHSYTAHLYVCHHFQSKAVWSPAE